MFKNLSGAKLGIFIFLGSTLLIIGIFMLGNKEALFRSTFTVKAYFQNIEGLRNGAPVRLSGVDVGAVKNIRIIGERASTIEVTMRLVSDVKKFIRKDTEAGIETEGLVGYKFIALYVKESKAEHVEDGGAILAKEPVSFADVIEETEGIMAYTKEMTKNLADIVSKMCVFFFFKQKTAYEIYQCDWSSDVCSSDLLLDCSAEYEHRYNSPGGRYCVR